MKVTLVGVPPRPVSAQPLTGEALEDWTRVKQTVEDTLKAWKKVVSTTGLDQHRLYIDGDLTNEQLTALRDISPLVVVSRSQYRSSGNPR